MIKKLLCIALITSPLIFANEGSEESFAFDGVHLSEDSTSERDQKDSKKVNVIPKKDGGGKFIRFQVDGALKTVIPATLSKGFNPYHDASSFTNFASLDKTEGVYGLTKARKKDYNSGTCFGISYFTHMWFARLIKPVLNGGSPVLQKDVASGYSYFTNAKAHMSNSDAGDRPTDGVNYAVNRVKSIAKDRSYFNTSKMKKNLNRFRLYKVTANSSYTEDIQKGMIGHHLDQSDVSRVYIDTSNATNTAKGISVLKSRIKRYGSQPFFFRQYESKSGIWNLQWGHACLVYQVSEVSVKRKGVDGEQQVRKALRFDFMDPNSNYRKNIDAKNGEGYKHYFLYFADAKQITFSNRVIDRYEFQTTSSVVDSKETRIGYYEIFEGAKVQDDIAYDRYVDCKIGAGMVLNSAQESALEEKFKECDYGYVKDKYKAPEPETVNYTEGPENSEVLMSEVNQSYVEDPEAQTSSEDLQMSVNSSTSEYFDPDIE